MMITLASRQLYDDNRVRHVRSMMIISRRQISQPTIAVTKTNDQLRFIVYLITK